MSISTKQWGARIIAALVLALGLSAGSWAEDEQYSPDTKAALLASPEISTTVQLKDGRTLSYRELVEMTETQQKEALQSVNRGDRLVFKQWLLDVETAEKDKALKLRDAALAKNAELDKRLAAQDAKNAELDKHLAAQDAKNAELDKHLAAQDAKNAELDKHLAVATAKVAEQAEIYVRSVENGRKAWRAPLIELSNLAYLPDSLKQRIRALLDNKNIQWRTDEP